MSSPVDRLLSGTSHGVMRHDGPLEVESAADSAGWRYVLLDSELVAEREEFLDRCADAFDLPRRLASTWEGLDTGLRGLDWDEPAGVLVVWQGWSELAEGDPDGFDCAIEVLRDACVAWKDDEVPGAVVLVGPGPETDLPEV
jgi:Barstar (barnase inhibitor)